ncbi:MAG: glycosyltransferase [Clostridia bacterium]|nr:glycosyltransferase [Clostridia bacterium]
MKKIIIVNNNMKVGGVQKSLCNLLWELDSVGKYDVTLLLFAPVGEYMEQLPPRVRCITCKGLFRYMGVSQGEMHGIDVLKRGALAAICRIFGRSAAIRIMRLGQKKLPETYDYAIAFLHNGRNKSFFGGVQDFVLHCINASKKITFLHDDYNKCGANHKVNRKIMQKFDIIAACSDGCRKVFESAIPELAYKCVTVRNCNNVKEIRSMADKDPVTYDSTRINMVCATRLSPRKGVDRAIEAVASIVDKGIPATLHILGSGVLEEQLKQSVVERHLDGIVVFHGQQSNPYRFIKNADLFLLTSYHEAAPMVIDESYILGVPVLVTRTNSSDEMVTDRACGWVCENDQQSLNQTLYELLKDRLTLSQKREELQSRSVDNSYAMGQFVSLVEEG